jgi:hypothetical protein
MSLKGIDAIFSTVVANIQATELEEPVIELLRSLDYSDFRDNSTYSHKILDKSPKLKKQFIAKAKEFIHGAMKYDCDIEISRSWFSKVGRKQEQIQHIHCNAWWTAVFYLQDNCEIILEKQAPAIFVEPVENNLLNSLSCQYKPTKGTLLIFPARTEHKIREWDGDATRYSLAFNIMPKGDVGLFDSGYTYGL